MIKLNNKLKNKSDHNNEKLAIAILESIYYHPSISKNNLKKKLAENGMSSISTIDKEMKYLLDIGIIEYRYGNRKHHYYIKGNAEPVSHDSKLANLISDLRKVIDKVEESSPDYDQYIKNALYEHLKNMTYDLQKTSSYYKEEKNNLQYIETEEDYYLEDINKYSYYDIEEIRSKINVAKKIYEEIKVLREKEVKEIQKMKQKECNKKHLTKFLKIIEEIKEKIQYLSNLQKELEGIKLSVQGRIFREIIRENQNPRKIVMMIKTLNNINMKNEKNNTVPIRLDEIINHLQKELKPIKKDMLIKKLVDTKKFSKDDLDHAIIQFEFNGEIGSVVLSGGESRSSKDSTCHLQ